MMMMMYRSSFYVYARDNVRFLMVIPTRYRVFIDNLFTGSQHIISNELIIQKKKKINMFSQEVL